MRQISVLLLLTLVLSACSHSLASVQNLSSPVSTIGSGSADLEKAIKAYRQRQADATPARVLAWLKAGNQRFAAGKSIHGGFPTDTRFQVQVTAQGQRPLAAVLSCIDARTTPELVFDVTVGDLFTPRVGANVINDDVIGSLEISIASGAKLVVIMGHTDCGGVKGACNNLQMGHVTNMLAKVKPAIATVNNKMDTDPAYANRVGERSTTNGRYVAEISHVNAIHSKEELLSRSTMIREKVEKGEIEVVSALYDVQSGKVIWTQ